MELWCNVATQDYKIHYGKIETKSHVATFCFQPTIIVHLTSAVQQVLHEHT